MLIIYNLLSKDEGTGAVKEFRQERKEFLHKKNEQIKKKGSGREEQVLILFLYDFVVWLLLICVFSFYIMKNKTTSVCT